jgi:hypothetical protein
VLWFARGDRGRLQRIGVAVDGRLFLGRATLGFIIVVVVGGGGRVSSYSDIMIVDK